MSFGKAYLEEIADWNIKGRYHFVVIFVPKLCCFLGFVRYRVIGFAVPQRYRT